MEMNAASAHAITIAKQLGRVGVVIDAKCPASCILRSSRNIFAGAARAFIFDSMSRFAA